MKYKVLISTVFCIIQAGVTLDAQDSGVPPSMYPNQPASPQAEAIARLGVYEMDNPMGMPDITIPLFDIEHYGFHIPLKLKYEAQPLKPGYNYDVFGKGWTMTGQSCVSRTIRSVADETRDFKLDSDQLEKIIYLSYNNNPFEYSKNYNFQYDIFNAVLPDGRTFDFFIHKESGNEMVYELSNDNADIKINCSFNSNNIDSFTITDEEGVVYGFSVADKATNDWLSLKRSNVTWLLSSIGLPNGGTIYYSYNDLQTIRTYTIDEPVLTFGQVYPYQREVSQGVILAESPYYFRLDLQPACSIYEMRFLKKISYGATSVNFSYKPDGQHLSEIKIVDSGNVIRKIAFNIPNGGISLNTLTFSGDNNTDRLVYKFNYTGYSSSSYTDHWGNYGNAGKNTDIGNFNFFIDDIGGSLDNRNGTVIGCVRVLTKNSSDIQSFHKLKSQISASGDSRTATSPDTHCILRTITYPNGGSTHFEFENHRFVTASSADGALEPDRRKQRIIEGGGFRIRSIINYSADGTLADRREYRYGYTFREIDAGHFPLPRLAGAEADRHIGCGEPVVDPNLLTHLNFDYSYNVPSCFLNMITGIRSGQSGNTFENISVLTNYQSPWWWEARLSALNFRNLLGNRPAVMYPQISVYYGDVGNNESTLYKAIGKTVYNYDIYKPTPANYLNDFYRKGMPDTIYYEPINYCMNVLRATEHGDRNSRLTSKIDYANIGTGTNANFKVTGREEYSYTDDMIYMNTGYIYNNKYNRGHCSYHDFKASVGHPMFSLNNMYSAASDEIGSRKLNAKTISKVKYSSGLNRAFSTRETYSYVYGDHLKQKTYHDNREMEITMTYPAEHADTSAICRKMVSRNMLASPVTYDHNALYSNSKIPVENYKTTYAEYTVNGKTMILPSIYHQKYKGQYEAVAKVLHYSEYGKPLEIVNLKTGIHTSYLWDDSGRYMTVEAKNATKAELESAAASVAGSGMEKLNKIRDILPDAEICTWSHIPHVGVSRFTDKDGHITGYEYDGLGRLVREVIYKDNVVSESNRQIVKSYEYEYKN